MIKHLLLSIVAFTILLGVVSLAVHSVDNTRARYEKLTNR